MRTGIWSLSLITASFLLMTNLPLLIIYSRNSITKTKSGGKKPDAFLMFQKSEKHLISLDGFGEIPYVDKSSPWATDSLLPRTPRAKHNKIKKNILNLLFLQVNREYKARGIDFMFTYSFYEIIFLPKQQHYKG